MTEAVFPPADDHQVLLRQGGVELLADRTFQHLGHLLHVFEQERQVQHADRRLEAGQQHVGGQHHVNGSQLSAFDQLSLLAELVGRKHFDFDIAIGLFGHQFGKFQRTDLVMMVRRSGMAQFEHEFLRRVDFRRFLFAGAATGQQTHREQHQD